MPNLKIAIELASLRQPLKKALHTAARLGAQAVELDVRNEIRIRDMTQTALRHLRKLLEDLDLSVSAVSFPTRRGYNVPDDLERRIDGTKAALEFAHKIGASVVVNCIGRVPEDDQSSAWSLLLEALTQIFHLFLRC